MSDFKPYRPKAIAAFNLLGRGAARFGLRSNLQPESLIKAARKKTGLQDFGDESFREPLDVLTRAIEAEANLHPFGRWVMRGRLVGLLATRLRVQDLFTRHPEIADEKIEAPLVIAGLQRTGTTMLHRLLAADPDNRALLSWEAISPAPDPKQKSGARDARIKQAEIAEKGLKYLAPEEDVLLMEFALMSQVPEAMMRIPSYSAWLKTQDAQPVYAYLKKLLQLLQWQRGAQRWVLKTPAHLEHLDALLTVFPDAKIIQTHRDPTRTTASFASMMTHGYGIFSDVVDSHAIAAHWHGNNARMMARALKVRAQKPESFIDVSYYDLIQDPMPQVERIYDFAGLALTAAAKEAMQASRKTNKQNKHGKHRYKLADFGLDQATVKADYADYLARFNIPSEQDKEGAGA